MFNEIGDSSKNAEYIDCWFVFDAKFKSFSDSTLALEDLQVGKKSLKKAITVLYEQRFCNETLKKRNNEKNCNFKSL